MTNKETFILFNQDINNNILTDPAFIKAEARGGMRKSVLSLENITSTDSFFSKKVLAYATAIDKGRGKNDKNSGGLYDAIYDWVGLKKYDIKYSNNKERKSIAFAITRKIAKRGTWKFKPQSRHTDIFQSAIDKSLPAMYKNIITQKEITTRSNIVDAYKK